MHCRRNWRRRSFDLRADHAERRPHRRAAALVDSISSLPSRESKETRLSTYWIEASLKTSDVLQTAEGDGKLTSRGEKRSLAAVQKESCALVANQIAA